jgi:hypothetical protein
VSRLRMTRGLARCIVIIDDLIKHEQNRVQSRDLFVVRAMLQRVLFLWDFENFDDNGFPRGGRELVDVVRLLAEEPEKK